MSALLTFCTTNSPLKHFREIASGGSGSSRLFKEEILRPIFNPFPSLLPSPLFLYQKWRLKKTSLRSPPHKRKKRDPPLFGPGKNDNASPPPLPPLPQFPVLSYLFSIREKGRGRAKSLKGAPLLWSMYGGRERRTFFCFFTDSQFFEPFSSPDFDRRRHQGSFGMAPTYSTYSFPPQETFLERHRNFVGLIVPFWTPCKPDPSHFYAQVKKLAKLFFASLPSPLFAKKKSSHAKPEIREFQSSLSAVAAVVCGTFAKKKKLGLRNPLLREIGGGGGGGDTPKSCFPLSPLSFFAR